MCMCYLLKTKRKHIERKGKRDVEQKTPLNIKINSDKIIWIAAALFCIEKFIDLYDSAWFLLENIP